MAILLFSPWISSEMAKPRSLGLRWASRLLYICIHTSALLSPSPSWSPSITRPAHQRSCAASVG